MKSKKDLVQMVGVLGTLLGVASTLITSYCNDKTMEQLVEEKVKEALKNMNK